MKNIEFTENEWEDFIYWAKNDRKTFNKISKLIEETSKEPYSGRGKPEALKHNLKGYWSRRITIEHRLIYSVTEDSIRIVSCRYHYSK